MNNLMLKLTLATFLVIVPCSTLVIAEEPGIGEAITNYLDYLKNESEHLKIFIKQHHEKVREFIGIESEYINNLKINELELYNRLMSSSDYKELKLNIMKLDQLLGNDSQKYTEALNLYQYRYFLIQESIQITNQIHFLKNEKFKLQKYIAIALGNSTTTSMYNLLIDNSLKIPDYQPLIR